MYFGNSLQRLRRLFSGAKTKPTFARRVPLHVESLEGRQLMSVSPLPVVPVAVPGQGVLQLFPVNNPNKPGVSMQGSNLVIQGTDGSEQVAVSMSGNMVKVDVTHPGFTKMIGGVPIQIPTLHDPSKYFAMAQVSRIYFFGNGGNDSFINNTAIDSSAYGNGSDFFRGGAGNDVLKGGAGYNVLEGGGGQDTVVVGAGDNHIIVAAQDKGTLTITGAANGHHNVLDFSMFGAGVMLDLRTTAMQAVHRLPPMFNQKLGFADMQMQITKLGAVQEVWGSKFSDSIWGGPGGTTVDGMGGDDAFIAGAGDLHIVVTDQDLGSVRVLGTANGFHNTLDFSAFGPSGITLDLRKTAWQTLHSTNNVADLSLKLAGTGLIQEVYGTQYADVLQADDNGDIIHGGAGNDRIYGGAGVDHLYADAGDDWVFAGVVGLPSYLYGGNGHSTLVTIGRAGWDNLYQNNGMTSFWVTPTDTVHYNSAVWDKYHVVHRVASFYNCTINGVQLGAPNTLRNTPFLAMPGDAGAITPDFSKNPLFSSVGPAANDIVQGDVGDCYLMSFLAGMAKASSFRTRQFVTDLGDGTYAVNFQNASHQDVFVRVDGRLPSYGGTSLVYAKFGAEQSIWVGIIEKAWTFFRKNAGTYDSIGYSPTTEDDELGTNFGVQHSRLLRSDVDGTTYLNAIRDAWLAGKAVEITGPYDSSTNPWTNQSTSPGDSQNFAHAYMVDHVWTDGQGNVTSIRIRDPYATNRMSGPNQDGYVTLTAATVAYGSCTLWTFSPF
jgi:hypothetical protein